MTVAVQPTVQKGYVQHISANRSHITVVQIHFKEGRIDETQHETAVVQPGDRIQWMTNWGRAGGPEIKIGRFKRIVNLGDLTHLGEPEDRLSVSEGSRAGTKRVGHRDLSGLGDHPDLESIFRPSTESELLTRNESGEYAEWLFAGGWHPPDDFLDPYAVPIISAPIANLRGHWLWSYEWEIDGVGVLDPHIFMHEDPRAGN